MDEVREINDAQGITFHELSMGPHIMGPNCIDLETSPTGVCSGCGMGRIEEVTPQPEAVEQSIYDQEVAELGELMTEFEIFNQSSPASPTRRQRRAAAAHDRSIRRKAGRRSGKA